MTTNKRYVQLLAMAQTGKKLESWATEEDKKKHSDNDLQTLFYPEDLERKGRALKKDTKRILDEKGTNTLHLSFGCLEWFETKDTRRNAPLLLLQVKLTENTTAKGPEYFIESTEGELFTNLPLSKKLLNDFRIKLPELKENQTIEIILIQLKVKL